MACALGVALGAAGCNGGEDPPSTNTTSSSSATSTATTSGSSSATSSATGSSSTAGPAPTVPALARERTDDGAKEFVRFYVDVLNDAYQDPANPRIAGLADKDCVACRNQEKQLADFVAKSQRLSSDLIDLPSLAMATEPTAETVILNGTLKYNRVEIVKADGSPTGKLVKAETVKRQIGLKWVKDAWVLYDME